MEDRTGSTISCALALPRNRFGDGHSNSSEQPARSHEVPGAEAAGLPAPVPNLATDLTPPGGATPVRGLPDCRRSPFAGRESGSTHAEIRTPPRGW